MVVFLNAVHPTTVFRAQRAPSDRTPETKPKAAALGDGGRVQCSTKAGCKIKAISHYP